MKIELDWQAGNDEEGWETIAVVEQRLGLVIPGWLWRVLLVALLTFGTGGYVVVRRRYEVALRDIAFQIQGAIDLEARALAQRDLELYLAQYDRASPDWYARQAMRARSDPLLCDSGTPGPDLTALQGDCASVVPLVSRGAAQSGTNGLVAPSTVQDVELWGDVAWVEVLAGQKAARQARFYRQTELGWVHTAPRVAFWRAPVERETGSLAVRYHRRDLPHVEPLVDHISRVVEDIDALFGSPAEGTLHVHFVADIDLDRLPLLSGDVLTLASPWLTGIPLEGTWGQAYLDELTYWVTYGRVSQHIRATADMRHEDADPPNGFQRAILDEYAILYSRQDTAQTPILRRVVAQHGVDALPEMLRSLKRVRTAPQFLARWPFLPPSEQETDYFETWLDIADEALGMGRGDTFALSRVLLLSDLARWGEWIERQELASESDT